MSNTPVEHRANGADPVTNPPVNAIQPGLRRATTAVAVVIGTLLALALAAMWQSRRATRLQTAAEQHQERAERAEAAARHDLWRALLAEARATRLSHTLSRREVTLDTLRRAAAIASSPELRDEAIATLALPDYHLESAITLDPGTRTSAFDREFRTCAVGLTNGDVVLYRLADAAVIGRFTLEQAQVPPTQGAPIGFDFAPSGRTLAVRYQRGALSVLDLETGRPRFTRDTDRTRRSASRPLFSSDGRRIVAPVFTPDGFEVMDAGTGTTVAHFPEISSFHHAAVRPGANQFAAFAGGQVHLLDWDQQRTVGTFPFPAGSRVLAWSPDGRQLAIGGFGSRVHIWDVPARRLLELPGHKADVFDLHFDRSGERLASVTADNTTRFWDLRDGQLMAVAEDRRMAAWETQDTIGWAIARERLEVRREVANLVCTGLSGPAEATDGATLDLSPDGRWAVSRANDDQLQVWNLLEPGAPLTLTVTNVQSLCFHPRQPTLFLMRNRHLEERAFQVETNGGRVVPSLGPAVPAATQMQRSADLVTVAAGGSTRAYVELGNGAVWAEHFDSGPALVRMRTVRHSSVARRSGSAHGTSTIAISPDGRWLVAAADGSLGTYLFDARTGEPLRPLDDESGGVQFSQDGRWLVLVASAYCRVFRTADWSLAWSKAASSRSRSYAGAAAFSPDGRQLACVLLANRCLLLETESGRELGTLEAPDGSYITLARWTPDGEQLVLATRDNRLNLWRPNALRGQLAALGIRPHTDPEVPSAAPSAPRAKPSLPGQWIASALLIGAGLAAVVALVALRHHRRLFERFTATEAQAVRHQQELRMERELGELKSRFVSMVSHEFRTPLGITMSAIELLRHHLDILPAPKRQELFDDIFNSTRQMAGLMEQVLLLGRVEAGRLAYRPAVVDLRTLCDKLVDESLSATSRRCPIEAVCDGALEDARADEALLRHIFSNLLSNAVKYSPSGAPVEFRVTRSGRDAVFTVRDRGIGIPEADLPKLYQAFHRAANVGETPGTGLGLVIVKRCIDLHQGRIQVQSQPGAGTTFTVTLPLFAHPAV